MEKCLTFEDEVHRSSYPENLKAGEDDFLEDLIHWWKFILICCQMRIQHAAGTCVYDSAYR